MPGPHTYYSIKGGLKGLGRCPGPSQGTLNQTGDSVRWHPTWVVTAHSKVESDMVAYPRVVNFIWHISWTFLILSTFVAKRMKLVHVLTPWNEYMKALYFANTFPKGKSTCTEAEERKKFWNVLVNMFILIQQVSSLLPKSFSPSHLMQIQKLLGLTQSATNIFKMKLIPRNAFLELYCWVYKEDASQPILLDSMTSIYSMKLFLLLLLLLCLESQLLDVHTFRFLWDWGTS